MVVVSETLLKFFPKRISRAKRVLAEWYFFLSGSRLSLPTACRLEMNSLAPVVRIFHNGEAIFFRETRSPKLDGL